MAKTLISDRTALAAHELAGSAPEAADLMARWGLATLREARSKQGDLLQAGLLELSGDGIRLSREGRERLENYIRLLDGSPSPETE